MNCRISVKIKSYAYNRKARKKITRMTTSDARNNSPRDGHDTLFISPSTEIKKSANVGICTIRKLAHNPTTNTTSGMKYLSRRCVASVQFGWSPTTPPKYVLKLQAPN